jgi:hypothetical protein
MVSSLFFDVSKTIFFILQAIFFRFLIQLFASLRPLFFMSLA